jgi:hypothetical protein
VSHCSMSTERQAGERSTQLWSRTKAFALPKQFTLFVSLILIHFAVYMNQTIFKILRKIKVTGVRTPSILVQVYCRASETSVKHLQDVTSENTVPL